MNITELDSFNLSDAVKFHNRLNPKIWGKDEKLLPEVRSKLLEIAADFQEFLGLSDLDVQDITVSGSNAAYSYTPHSDIDLHLVVNVPEDEVYQELFNAKKYQYNDLHDIRIHGADVELYVQPANESAVSLGEYSIKNDQWIQVPRRKRAHIDQSSVRHKYEDLQARIKSALKEDNSDRIQLLIDKIRAMRQSGLDEHGEFGPENLAFKMLRTQGWIKKLYDALAAAKNRELSLKEQNKPKSFFRWGFSGKQPETQEPAPATDDYATYFKGPEPFVTPTGEMVFKSAQEYEYWLKKQQQAVEEGHQGQPYSSEDGVAPSTCMFLNEKADDVEPVVQDFIKVVAKRLGIRELPRIKLHTDTAWSTGAHSFGRYDPDTHELNVSLPNRHILDVLRTVAHELTHCKQNQDHPLPDDAGATGSQWENEANARAGIFMRDFAAAHPEYFEQKPLGESASGYIPTKKQAKDPRYSMALTVDIKPGQVGKEANKMKLDTDSQGKPGLLMKTVNLRESIGLKFLGEYPSIATALGEAQADLVKYKKGQERQIHKDLALKHNKKDFDYDYDNEADWEDSHYVTDYTGGTSQYINDILHQHYRNQLASKKDLQRYQRHIAGLDRILSGKKLKQPVTVYTTVPVSPADAWEKYGVDVNEPIRLHLPAYTSTSTSLDVVQNIADDRLEPVSVDRQRHPPRNAQKAPQDNWGNQILMLSIPAGTPAASVQKISEYPDENEILMPRGMDIVVNPNPTVLDNGDYVWHAQVIGHNPVQIVQPKGLAESLAAEFAAFGQSQPAHSYQSANRIDESINEVFNTPATGVKWDTFDPDLVSASFTASNGVPYELHITAPYIGPDQLDPYDFFGTEMDDQARERARFVEFEVPPKKPNSKGKQGIEGTGSAAEVFGIVTNALVEYAKKFKPSMLYFQAVEPNRARLYAAIAKRVAQSMPGWALATGAGGHHLALYNKRIVKSKPMAEHNLVESLRQEFTLLEEEYLGEIKMSPSNLRAEAAKTGAMAGMEFEMIVPNVNVESEPEYEPNMDQDTRSRDFDDIRSFFYDGDYNSRRDVDNLMQALQEQFDEWGEEQIQEAWDDEGLDYLREYIETNEYWDEAEAQEEITNALQAEYGDDISGEDFEKMLNAMAEQKFNEFVQDQWDNQGRYYDEALDQYRDEQRGEQSERDWLDDTYPYMSDISNSFDITWPYYTNINDNNGEMDIDNVADDFSRAIGKPINASSSYHGARREAGHYVVEPDGSLDPDDSDDGGLEFVSPPMPIDELLSDLNKVKAWADRTGCYTNKSTGLHINISVPNYSLDKLDYVKLALLLGDRYVLDQYGRSSNTYAKSALGKVQDLVKRNPDSAKALLDKMRGGMEELATKAIHSGTTDKYTSINTKSGYIEFRSPGGDWLDANFDKIENTLLRFTVALSAAINPEAYREEYLKKLYKLLEPTAVETKGADTIKYFSDYVAGKMPKAALRSFVKQAQLQRRIEKDPTGGQKYWWRVDKEGRNAPNTASIEIVATSREGAIAAAAMEWGNSNLPNADAYPIRPYDESPVRASVGAAQPVGQASGPTAGGRASNPEGAWILAPRGENPPVPLYRFNASGVDDANTVLAQWQQEHPGNAVDVHYDPQITRGQPPIPGSTLDRQRQRAAAQPAGQQGGNWGIWLTGENRFSRAPGQADNSVLRRFPSREAAEQWIEQTRATNPALRPDIEVREIEPAAQQSDSGIEYIIFNINNRSQLTGFRAVNQAAAEREAESILRDLGLDPDQYDVRERHARPAQQPAAQATQQPAQNPPQPLGRGRELIGWSVRLPSGEEVTQIHGIGNNQGDANRIAAGWLRQNGYGVSGEGYEVVPLWREA